MKDFFSIKEAAQIVGMTSEALRHYDRVGLVKPCYKDEITGYRYYSEQELTRLRTVELLKTMDLSLKQINEILTQNDLTQIIALLKQAEKNADDKIARLRYAKAKIQRASADYEKKLANATGDENGAVVRRLPRRVILLSNYLEEPTLKNLWNYQSHFYKQLGAKRKADFLFEDTAGMLVTPEKTRLFAVCLQYPSLKGLAILPEGDYLCAGCGEENRVEVLQALQKKAKEEFGVCPGEVIHQVVVTGVLQWNYQVQLRVGPAEDNIKKP